MRKLICLDDDPRLTLTYFMARSNQRTCLFRSWYVSLGDMVHTKK